MKGRLKKLDYAQARKAQDQQIMESEGQINCVSCGCTLVGPSGQGVRLWGHSHNLPVRHFPQFECDSENFKPRCQNFGGEQGCHEKLDIPDFEAISKFLDFEQLLQYRKSKDIYSYNRWISGLIAIGNTNHQYLFP